MNQDKCIGVIICKLDRHRDALRGYIAMLSVKREYRKRKIGLYFGKLQIFFLTNISREKIYKNRKSRQDKIIIPLN